MAKENELTPSKLIDNLKERVKIEFVNLVPDEEWDKLIKETINDFKEQDLKNVITQELRNHYQEVIKKYLAEKSRTGKYDDARQRYELDQGLEKIILAMAPQIFESMISEQIRQALNYLQQRNY